MVGVSLCGAPALAAPPREPEAKVAGKPMVEAPRPLKPEAPSVAPEAKAPVLRPVCVAQKYREARR